MKHNMTYPIILGLEEDDFYDIKGDMIEYIYNVHKSKRIKSDLLVTCFEFGTKGASILNVTESFKAVLFENSSHFKKQPAKFKEYSEIIYKEQFLPKEDKWRIKAEQDFLLALTEIISYKKL